MNIKHKIIGLIVLVLFILYLIKNRSEHAGSLSNITSNTSCNIQQSNEAIQNILSTYNTQNMSLTNLHVTGDLTLDNNTDIEFMQLTGIIVAWSGSIENIPSGWGLCDGSTYTTFDGTSLVSPDLRSKFILGSSKPDTPSRNNISGPTGQPSYTDSNGKPFYLTPQQVNTSGGTETHKLTLDEIPSHYHLAKFTLQSGSPVQVFKFSNYWGQGNIYTQGEGGDKPHNNMPPYYALAYIVKL